MAAAVSAISAFRLTSGVVTFSRAGAVATLSAWVRGMGAGLVIAGGLGVLAIAGEVEEVAKGGDAGAVKAAGLATGGCGCATTETGALFAGLLLRPTA